MRWRLIEQLQSTTLRTRLTLWNVAVVILLVTATLLVVEVAVRELLYSQADAELRGAATEVALAIQELGYDENAIAAELRRKESSHAERGWFLQLLTTDGRTVWKSDHCPAEVVNFPPADLDRTETIRQVGQYRYVRTRVARHTGPSYLVRVGTYTTGLDASRAGLIRLLTAVGVALALLAPLAAWWLAGRATRPVGTMLRTARRLSPTRLSDRLAVRGTSDELDLLANTINGLLDAVAGHVEKQEQFVADAAHELRGPLAALQGSIEAALGRAETTSEQQETLSDMLEAARHLSKIANDLLLLAESGSPGRPGHRMIIDLSEVTRQAVTMFSGVAEEAGIRLRVADVPPADVRGDTVELRRLVSNLLDNAIRFTRSGGTIDVRIVDAMDHVILTVTDTGSGIAPADLEHVFDRFFKADPSRTHGPSGRTGGLGLAICRSIAESHGGTIGIRSRVGEGTTVTVRLPAAAARAPQPTQPHATT